MDETLEKPENVLIEEPTPGCYVKARHVLALMLFLGTFNAYALRVNLNVAIVAMVNSTESKSNITNVTTMCPDHGASSIHKVGTNGVFQWNPNEQGLLLGCYYYGYIFTCLPGGYLTNRFGIKPILGLSTLLSSIITIVTPYIANISFSLLVSSRILLGLFQGFTLPAVQSTWGRWAPPMERSYLIATSFSGISFGIFFTQITAGAIAENIGWEAVFYSTGGAGLLWTAVWFAIIHSWPEIHPRISTEEKNYILRSIGVDENKKKRPAIPWFSILTSTPAWAVTVSQLCNLWGVYTLLTMLPTYIASILRFSLTASGGIAAVPYIIQFFLTLGVGYMSDQLISRGWMSTIAVRKMNNTIALVVPATMIFAAGYVGCNVQAAMAVFTIGRAFNCLTVCGCEANTVDLAPQFAGILYGITNTLCNIPGFVAPQLIGFMLEKDGSLNQWRNIFYMTAAIYMFGAIFYLIFGSAKLQSWANGKDRCTEAEYAKIKADKGCKGDDLKFE